MVAGFFVVIFPGNIAQYAEGTDAFGLDTDTKRLVRLFFQPVLVVSALGQPARPGGSDGAAWPGRPDPPYLPRPSTSIPPSPPHTVRRRLRTLTSGRGADTLTDNNPRLSRAADRFLKRYGRGRRSVAARHRRGRAVTAHALRGSGTRRDAGPESRLHAAAEERTGCPCLVVRSGRLALYLALRHWFHPGDRLLMSPITDDVVLFVVLAAGLRPVAAPVSPWTGNIEVAAVPTTPGRTWPAC